MLPDVEAMVVFFLTTKLGVKVGTRVPNPRPDTFVRAWRSGGAAVNRVLDEAQITVSVWGPSTTAASELAQRVRHALLSDNEGMTLVRGVEETGGLYFDPDPSTGTARYTFTVSLLVRANR